MQKFHFYAMVDLAIALRVRSLEAREEAQRAAVEADWAHAVETQREAKTVVRRRAEVLKLRAFHQSRLEEHRRMREDAAVRERERQMEMVASSPIAWGSSSNPNPHHNLSPSPRRGAGIGMGVGVGVDAHDLAMGYNHLLMAADDHTVFGGGSPRANNNNSSTRASVPSIYDYLSAAPPTAVRAASQRSRFDPNAGVGAVNGNGAAAHSPPTALSGVSIARRSATPINSYRDGQHRLGVEGGAPSPTRTSLYASPPPHLRPASANSTAYNAASSPNAAVDGGGSPSLLFVSGDSVFIPHLAQYGVVIATQVAGSRRQSVSVFLTEFVAKALIAGAADAVAGTYMHNPHSPASQRQQQQQHQLSSPSLASFPSAASFSASAAHGAQRTMWRGAERAHEERLELQAARVSEALADHTNTVWCEAADCTFVAAPLSQDRQPYGSGHFAGGGGSEKSRWMHAEFLVRRHFLGPAAAAEGGRREQGPQHHPTRLASTSSASVGSSASPHHRGSHHHHHQAPATPHRQNAVDGGASSSGDGAYGMSSGRGAPAALPPTFTLPAHRAEAAAPSRKADYKGWSGQVLLLKEMEENAARIQLNRAILSL